MVYSVEYMYQNVYLAFNVQINAVYKDNSKESQEQNTVSTTIINPKFNTYYRSEMEIIHNTATNNKEHCRKHYRTLPQIRQNTAANKTEHCCKYDRTLPQIRQNTAANNTEHCHK
jgi:DNA topoisomerase IB